MLNIQRSHHLATRRHYLYKLEIQPPSDTTCNCWKIGHQMASLQQVENLATMWRHLHFLEILPPGGATFFSWRFGHQVLISSKFGHQSPKSHHIIFISYLHHHVSLLPYQPPCRPSHQPPCQPPCLSPLSSSPYYGITNRQSYISKVLSLYLHSPGSHQLTWFLESVSDWQTDWLTLVL